MASFDSAPDFLSAEDVFQHAPCGYVIFAADGRIERVNATVRAWTGKTNSDLVGKRLPDLLNVAGRIFYETHFAPMLRMQGFLNEVALDLKNATGEPTKVLVNAVERRDGNGTIVGTYVVMFPASERRRYERDLVDAQTAAEASRRQIEVLNASLADKVEQAVAERLEAERGLLAERETAVLREQFIAVLGHDLRNPLASISSAARILSRETLSDRGLQVITLMQGSVARMAGLIDNVLDFARGSLGGGIGIKVEIVERLDQFLLHVVDELQVGRPDGAIIAEIDIPVAIACDAGRIGQLVSNLLGNALTHGAEGSAVRIKASVQSDLLEIAVSNSGVPIAELALNRLFQPFFRGDGQDVSQGLGLGLHIASEIAKAHHGTLSVTSNDRETRFEFLMPVRP